MAMSDAVLARLLVDDQSKIGFMSFQRNAERSRKVAAAFREQGVDQIVSALDKQVRAMRLSSKELDLYNAAVLGATDAQIQQINKAYEAIDAIQAQAAEQERLAQEQQDAQRQSDQLTSAIDRKIQALRDEAATLDMTEDEIEQYKLAQMGATQAQIDAVMAERRHVNALKEQQKETANATRGLRMMRGGFGQVGHQIQDIAVQLQMGQNALLVFGQQGSQIVSLFGGRGAMVGAFLAVGAAIGTYFMPKVFKTTDAIKDLKKVSEETAKLLKIDFVTGVALLSKQFEEMAARSEDLARSSLQLQLVNALERVEDSAADVRRKFDDLFPKDMSQALPGQEFEMLSRKLNIAADDLEGLNALFVSFTQGTGATIQEVAKFSQGIADNIDVTDSSQKAFLTLNQQLQEYAVLSKENQQIIDATTQALTGKITKVEGEEESTDDSTRALERSIEKRREYLQSLQEELWSIGKTNVEIAVRKALLMGMSEEEVNLVRVTSEKIRVTNAYYEALDQETAASQIAADARKNFVDGVVAQSEALGKSNIELLIAKANTMGLSEAQNQAFIDAINNLQKFKDAQDAASKREQTISALTPIMESLMSEEQLINESYIRRNQIIASALDQQIITLDQYNQLMLTMEQKQQEDLDKLKNREILRGSELTGSMLDQLGKQFSGVQAVNKKMFAAQKAYKIASAIQNTYTAANEALASPYPWPLPQIFAATAIAAGMANVAQIKASSFAGGGFTGMGSRSGGMDGKGGFPAILHPNETVIDHTKGQGQGITIVTNVDARGSGPDVEMKIRKAVEQGNKQTVAIIRDLAGRGRLV